MKQLDIEKGNKLIAKFLSDEPKSLEQEFKKAGIIESMHYHDSWDWLMPACKKFLNTYPRRSSKLQEFAGTFDLKKIYTQLVFLISHI